MVVALLFVTVVTVSALAVAVVLVSVASRREDAAWSLGRPASGPLRTAARRLLDFRSEDIDWPRPKSQRTARSEASAADGHAWSHADTPPLLPEFGTWPNTDQLPGQVWLVPAHPGLCSAFIADDDWASGVKRAAAQGSAASMPLRPAAPA